MGVEFEINGRLLQDTRPVGEMDLCSVLLMRDRRFAWLILVPRIARISEIFELARGERALMMEEIAQASEALEGVTGCDKINVAALGNQVSQLHIHIIARSKSDPAWPNPVWGAQGGGGENLDYEKAKADELIHEVARALSIQPRINVV